MSKNNPHFSNALENYERRDLATIRAMNILSKKGIIDPVFLRFEKPEDQYDAIQQYRAQLSKIVVEIMNQSQTQKEPESFTAKPSFKPYKDD